MNQEPTPHQNNETTAQLTLDQVSIGFVPGTHVVKTVSMQLMPGEIGCLLGPSGCGKTTLLRSVAGFEPVQQGEIHIASQLMSRPKFNMPAEQRKVGMVFQDFALFPHLTVAQNISFGLSKRSKKEQQTIVDELLSVIDLTTAAASYPHQLSGGQQQRVALARAIAPEPRLMLLDEPFSSLDSTLREDLARQVRQWLKAKNITALMVTHDQYEAFAIADKVGVMSAGELLQWCSPYDLYHQPANAFVANFVGEGSLVEINTRQPPDWLGEDIKQRLTKAPHTQLLVRPDDVMFEPESRWQFTVQQKWFRGAVNLYQLTLPDGQKVLCETPSHVNYQVGESLPVTFNLQHLVSF